MTKTFGNLGKKNYWIIVPNVFIFI